MSTKCFLELLSRGNANSGSDVWADKRTEHTDRKASPLHPLPVTALLPPPLGHVTMAKSLPLENKVGTCLALSEPEIKVRPQYCPPWGLITKI